MKTFKKVFYADGQSSSKYFPQKGKWVEKTIHSEILSANLFAVLTNFTGDEQFFYRQLTLGVNFFSNIIVIIYTTWRR